ncbi:MAG: addiction module antidote protein [Duganella sp.]
MTRQNRNSQPHDEVVAEMLREDPAFRVALVQEVLSNGDQADMLILLRQLAAAEGGMKVIAERTGLNETALYRVMSPEGNPALRTFTTLLDSLGLRLSVVAKQDGQPLAT